MSLTHAALLHHATEQLAAAGVDNAPRDARLMMRWATGLTGAALTAELNEACTEDAAQRFAAAATRRAGREPLSHITGQREFWGRQFHVSSDVLDPRPETECLIAEALHRGPFERILDLGTGSGCILLTLLAEWPDASGEGIDLSPAALSIAARNANALDVASRADLRLANWTDGQQGDFDLIVSNPPYLADGEMVDLSPEVRNFEPHMALAAGADGLAAYRIIAANVRPLMRRGAVLMLEIGPTQSEEVCALLANTGLNIANIIPDLDQRARVIVARR